MDLKSIWLLLAELGDTEELRVSTTAAVKASEAIKGLWQTDARSSKHHLSVDQQEVGKDNRWLHEVQINNVATKSTIESNHFCYEDPETQF